MRQAGVRSLLDKLCICQLVVGQPEGQDRLSSHKLQIPVPRDNPAAQPASVRKSLWVQLL